jgi:hypothetical protein
MIRRVSSEHVVLKENTLADVSVPAELPSDLSQEDVRRLARGLGLAIPEENLAEVTYRYTALLAELNKLKETDLAGVDPSPVFSAES